MSSADGYGYDYDSPPRGDRRQRVAKTDQSSDSGEPRWVTPGMFEHLKRIQAAHMRRGDAGDAPGARRLLDLHGAETGDDAVEAGAQSDNVDSTSSGDAADSRNKGMFTALGITVRNKAGPVGQQAVALRSLLSLPHCRSQQGHVYSPWNHRANKGRFTALGITVRNTAGTLGQQAIALRSEDLSAFFECELDGNQDTLYPHSTFPPLLFPPFPPCSFPLSALLSAHPPLSQEIQPDGWITWGTYTVKLHSPPLPQFLPLLSPSPVSPCSPPFPSPARKSDQTGGSRGALTP
ncbi:unnamed protein product [Closterium sp. NIES-65]|nr:unnamed protein product [Closterium sp. NIES-65]